MSGGQDLVLVSTRSVACEPLPQDRPISKPASGPSAFQPKQKRSRRRSSSALLAPLRVEAIQ